MIEDSGTVTQHGRDQQLKRFEALRALGAFDGRSVLEVGCGNGDFYRYLRSCGERPDYMGLDADLDLIVESRARFRDEESCRFEAGTPARFQPANPFDYVLASGMLDAAGVFAGGAALLETLTRLFSWCTVGAAASFASARLPGRLSRGVPRVDPAAAVKAALRLTPTVRLAHDYLPADFTIYLYRTPSGDAGASPSAVKGATR